MKITIRILLSTLLFVAGITSFAQDQTISGKVTTFGEIPLNNVKISSSKTDQVTQTDSLGQFSIRCADNDRLIFSASGFDNVKIRTKNLKDPGHTAIDLVYSNKDNSFAEATKNGHIREEVLKEAMKKYPLKGEKDYSNYTSIFQLIDNEIYNVYVNGDKVFTQNKRSITGSQEVLYVVDGLIVTDITYITPAEVKSIRYVDGPQAAVYGSRGGNGAIEIKLK